MSIRRHWTACRYGRSQSPRQVRVRLRVRVRVRGRGRGRGRVRVRVRVRGRSQSPRRVSGRRARGRSVPRVRGKG